MWCMMRGACVIGGMPCEDSECWTEWGGRQVEGDVLSESQGGTEKRLLEETQV